MALHPYDSSWRDRDYRTADGRRQVDPVMERSGELLLRQHTSANGDETQAGSTGGSIGVLAGTRGPAAYDAHGVSPSVRANHTMDQRLNGQLIACLLNS
jgi:hypothetical protein